MEQPNTIYIDELSGNNIEFKEKLIAILKKELPEEVARFNILMKEHDLKKASESVHKLKHKISMLSLEKDYHIAEQFEKNLKENKMELIEDFESILTKMQNFITKL